MNKVGIFYTLIVLLAVLPLTYIVGRGGHHSGRGGYHHNGRGYHRGGYWGRSSWAVPAVIGGVALGAAVASSSSDGRSDDVTYYPEDYDTDYDYQNEVYTAPKSTAPTRYVTKKAPKRSQTNVKKTSQQVSEIEDTQAEEEIIENSAGA